MLNFKVFITRFISNCKETRISSKRYLSSIKSSDNSDENRTLKEELSKIYEKLEKESSDPETFQKLKNEIESNLNDSDIIINKNSSFKDEKPKTNPIDNEKNFKSSGGRKRYKQNIPEKDTVSKEAPSQRKPLNLSDVIPKNLIIKNLVWPSTNSRILLIGVERRNLLHASFIQGIF